MPVEGTELKTLRIALGAIDATLLPELRAKHPVRTATSVPRQFLSRGRGRQRLLAGSLALSLSSDLAAGV